MNQLDLLIDEKEELQKAVECLQETLKYLNPMREADFYRNIESQKKLMEKHLVYLEAEIEKTKQRFNAIIVTQIEKGHMLVAKKDDGTDVFLRLAYLPERAKAKEKAPAFLFDWVSKIEDDCFIVFDNYNITEADFKKIYVYHKNKNGLEKGIIKDSLKLRKLERELKHNYIFEEQK